MRKSLLALAAFSVFAGQHTAAMAQSSVTLYGVIDTAIEYVNRVSLPNGTGSRIAMTNLGGQSPSRWGLRGSEDLGGGLSAYFWLENGFFPDTGGIAPSATSPLFGRMSAVGLRKNGIGAFSFGRQITSMFDGVANFYPMRLATTYEPAVTGVGINYREDNMMKYAADFGPLHVGAHYSFGTGTPLQNGVASTVANGELPGNHRAQTAFGATVAWLGGSFGGTLGYDQFNPASSATSGTGTNRMFNVAGSYTAGSVKMMAGYRWRNNEFPNGSTAIRDDFYWTGVAWHAAPALDLSVGYYFDNVKRATLTPAVPASNLPNFTQVALVADYSLSKRTDVYIATSWSHNGALNYDSLINTAGLYGYGNAASITGLVNGQKDMVGVAVGLRHIF